MFIEYNLKNIENLCDDFYNATNINLSILDSSFNVLFINRKHHNSYCELVQSTKKGHELCIKSDEQLLLKCKENRTPQYHLCMAGLMDIAVPIIYDDEIIGYIILGQIKTNSEFKKPDFEIENDDIKLFEKEFLALTKYSDTKIHSTLSIASILAKHLLLEKIIKVKTDKNIENVINYIKENLTEKNEKGLANQ